MSKEISKEKTNSLLNCPFCGETLRKIGSKRLGNQFYAHDLNGPDCILKEFAFKADDEEKIKRWNTRKPMQNIVERLGNKHNESTINYHNLKDASCLGERHAYRNAIEIVKEEGE